MAALKEAFRSSTRSAISVFSSHLPPSERSLVSQKLQSLIDYNVGVGKNIRAQLVLSSFDAVGGTIEKRETASRSAVAIEMLQSSFLVADDIMDNSDTRRGKPCWYRKEEIGLSAVNDAFLLQAAAENEMREAFRGHPKESLAVSAFQSTTRKTLVGQMLDAETAGKMEDFNWQRYSQLVEHKTSHYTFILPLSLGIHAGGMEIPMQKVIETALKMGYLFQSQDDWLDVYGKSALTGKMGSDIKEKKCTWLSCKAMEILNETNDGRINRFKSAFVIGDEDEVKRIYDQLQLSQRFKSFEEEYSRDVIKETESIPHMALASLLRTIVTETKGRQK